MGAAKVQQLSVGRVESKGQENTYERREGEKKEDNRNGVDELKENQHKVNECEGSVIFTNIKMKIFFFPYFSFRIFFCFS